MIWRIGRVMLLCCIMLLSCKRKEVTGVVVQSGKKIEKEKNNPYIKGNQKIVQLENEEIELFIKRYQWEMKSSQTGLRIELIKTNSEGKTVQESDTVRLKYRMLLLNGTEIYNSEQNGEKQFVVDKSEEITGLHEAVKLMRTGEQARLIIPSHLAYGATGNRDKIDAYTPLALIIEIIDSQ